MEIENKKYSYQYGVDSGILGVVESIWSVEEGEIEYIAMEAAQLDWCDNDGWEDSWPVNISIYSENNELLGVCVVEVESVPEFSSRLISEPQTGKGEG